MRDSLQPVDQRATASAEDQLDREKGVIANLAVDRYWGGEDQSPAHFQRMLACDGRGAMRQSRT